MAVPSGKPPLFRRISTGVKGLDAILGGGLPDLSINIVMGRPGTGKTILTHQAIFASLQEGQRALYLTTLAEPSMKMLRYLQKFSFVDPTKMGKELIYLDIGEVIREQGIEETIRRILEVVKEHKPAIVAVDSFKAIHDLASGPPETRKFSFDLAVQLAAWGVTAFLIGEYSAGDIQREPIFSIADSIICMHYETQGLHTLRFIEVAKVRGSDFFEGMHPYVISPDGLKVYSRIKTPDTFHETIRPDERVSSGLPAFDAMLGGGLPAGSATMLAGGAGTGKTLLALHFIAAAAARGEPSVVVSYQETPAQLARIAKSFGWDIPGMVARGLLKYLYRSPVEIQPDIHLREIRDTIEGSGAKLVMIDSLKDLEIATPDKLRYKDYVYSLVQGFKSQGVSVIMTNEIMELFGPFLLSEYGVSFMADNVILLRYVELAGRMSRALSVMKMRGSQHSKEITEFEITGKGFSILSPIRAYTGILTGTPTSPEQGPMAYLPPPARQILQALKLNGESDLARLLQLTGLAEADVLRELMSLQQQGFVIAVPGSEGRAFKPAI
jgi:circadian clock protein KaiC